MDIKDLELRIQQLEETQETLASTQLKIISLVKNEGKSKNDQTINICVVIATILIIGGFFHYLHLMTELSKSTNQEFTQELTPQTVNDLH